MKIKKEYGGYLPFELLTKKTNENWFDKWSNELSCLYFNSARSSIAATLINNRAEKVFIPYYNCEAVEKTLMKYGFRIYKYYLDENLLPNLVGGGFGNDDWLIYIDYFGIDNQNRKETVVKKFQRVILDNTQSFYSEPIIGKSVFNIYSFRKFFGMADGGCVVFDKKNSFENNMYEKDISYDRYNYLFKCIELGTNEAYADSLVGEESIGYTIKKISDISLKMLSSIDYKYVKECRNNNASIMHSQLSNINELKFTISDSSPMVYPLLIRNEDLRIKLINNRIYIPQWWRYLINIVSKDSKEYNFSKFLLPLPIDQRYSKEDIINISRIVLSIV